MRTVDVHCHYIPAALIDLIRSDDAKWGITLVESNRGECASFAGKDLTQPFPRGIFDLCLTHVAASSRIRSAVKIGV